MPKAVPKKKHTIKFTRYVDGIYQKTYIDYLKESGYSNNVKKMYIKNYKQNSEVDERH